MPPAANIEYGVPQQFQTTTNSSTFCVGDKKVFFVNSLSLLEKAVEDLTCQKHDVLGVDAEGFPQLSLLQIATYQTVYLFDIHVLGAEVVVKPLENIFLQRNR